MTGAWIRRSKYVFVITCAYFGWQSSANVQSKQFAGSIIASSYRPTFRSCNLENGTEVTEIRKFQTQLPNQVLQNYSLIVNNNNFDTLVVSPDLLLKCKESYPFASAKSASESNSRYLKALARVSTENESALQNAGATHQISNKQNLYLTVDLCPSHKVLDAELFEKIQGGVRPVPVVISISGYWLMSHEADFKHLLKMESDGEIAITWANHSYSHPYDPKLPNAHNFLLEKNVNLESEVFKNEILILNHGIVPSVYFRFPGLVSDKKEVDKIREWGLLPLGADAWLALGEKPNMGSFILVHGNGNEPAGLKLLYNDLTKDPEMKKEFSDIDEAFE